MSAAMMFHSEMHGSKARRPVAAPPGLNRQAQQEILPVLHFAPDESIFVEGDATRGMYRVVGGMARACKFLADGRRHIDAFYKPGDVFGFELGQEHQFSAEAVSACALVKLRRPAMDSDPATALPLYRLAMRSLARAQAHAQLLGRCSAGQKLATFLLDMQEGKPGDMVELPMARQDIADYLGLTIETVSRTLAQFEKDGVLALITARRIRVLQTQSLAALCG